VTHRLKSKDKLARKMQSENEGLMKKFEGFGPWTVLYLSPWLVGGSIEGGRVWGGGGVNTKQLAWF
jgi:hypothetical protein